ncbi:glycosyltransferase family 4 protein [Novosphingobium album (ex Hu et al. 2023)]|uniref:Glycosyltransferase family 4 protein n=1 Tax=Novosphingobium album (ex Hu et al. 2023) TaxID=2930093 RepID=A0ABT0B402_9SPHN|nr:glycosyltransferase family 1 protein [Novosphingobium album (ex Hu et al. 2023)]MCJ2179785.1 glycosyltransferase family 4 protein [Novosphingobium album (ex Hu et al. 2023)]
MKTPTRPGSAILLNGRFLGRAMTGVDRTALNIGRALSALVQSMPTGISSFDVAVPAGTPSDAEIRAKLQLPDSSRILRSVLKGYAWEQLVLPMLQPQSILLNLCNTGPAFRRRQLVLIHDAQVFDTPESYSATFRSVYHWLVPQLAKRSMLVATVSSHSQERLKLNGVGTDRHWELLPNGADHLQRQKSEPTVVPQMHPGANGYLLALGSTARHKNIETVMRSLPDNAPPLVVAGGGASVARLVEEFGKGKAVHVGRVSDGQIKALYENALCFLFPSLTEGFGLPPLEAMSCGCPVIVSRGGAIPEVCGDAAIYCDALDQTAWRSAISDIMADVGLRERLIEKGRQRAARYKWHDTARTILALISEYRTEQPDARSSHGNWPEPQVSPSYE